MSKFLTGFVIVIWTGQIILLWMIIAAIARCEANEAQVVASLNRAEVLIRADIRQRQQELHP
jgi:hypothetical protein